MAQGEWNRHPFLYVRRKYYLVSEVCRSEGNVCIKAKKHSVNMRITTILYFAKVAYYLCGKDVLDYWLEITR